MNELPKEYINRMTNLLGGNAGSFFKSYSLPVVKGVRVNTLKISVEEFLRRSPVHTDGNVPWEESGFYAFGESLGKTVMHAAGAYYVQEPSAMCAVPELEIKAGERVLDLCAAPGGKTTQIAQYMNGSGILVSNEINSKRCEILRKNIERMGVKNSVTTNCSPRELKEHFKNYFNKILVDAPCSGEGMFKKEENAIPEWSTENVKICADRQIEILECAHEMLAVGGRIVYSTCTFSPEEDEEQIENFISTHPEYNLIKQKKLLPHEVRGEGHFCAVLEKTEGEANNLKQMDFSVDKALVKEFNAWAHEVVDLDFKNLCQFGDNLCSLPEGMPEIKGLHGVRAGVLLGGFVNGKKRFEPSHTLAMCLKQSEVKHIEVDEQTALKYLRGLTFDCGENDGWKAVTYNGLTLGWCKAVGGVAKNHLPKGLRI